MAPRPVRDVAMIAATAIALLAGAVAFAASTAWVAPGSLPVVVTARSLSGPAPSAIPTVPDVPMPGAPVPASGPAVPPPASGGGPGIRVDDSDSDHEVVLPEVRDEDSDEDDGHDEGDHPVEGDHPEEDSED